MTKWNEPIPLPDLRDDHVVRTRFMRHVRTHGLAHGMWIWTGASGHRGYGKFRWQAHMVAAHRMAHALFIGAVPLGQTVHHLPVRAFAPVKLNVNPQHLSLMPLSANVAEGNARRGRPVLGVVDDCPDCGGLVVPLVKGPNECVHCGWTAADDEDGRIPI